MEKVSIMAIGNYQLRGMNKCRECKIGKDYSVDIGNEYGVEVTTRSKRNHAENLMARIGNGSKWFDGWKSAIAWAREH